MLADGDSLYGMSVCYYATEFCTECDVDYLLDQHVEVLGDFRCEA